MPIHQPFTRLPVWLRRVLTLLAVVLLAWSGAFGGPLTAAMELVLRGLCRVVQFPFALVEYYFF